MRIQFSVRSVFLLMLMVAMPLGWQTDRALRQARTVAKIKEMRGRPWSLARSPTWLWSFTGEFFGHYVIGVEIPQGKAELALPELKNLADLRVVLISADPQEIDTMGLPGPEARAIESTVQAQLPGVVVAVGTWANGEASRLVTARAFQALKTAARRSNGTSPYGEVVCLIQSADLRQSLIVLDKMVLEHPKDKGALRCRAFVHLLLGNPPAALADFDKVIGMDPRDAAALYGRGETKCLLGNALASIGDLDQATRLDSDYAAPYLARDAVQSEFRECIHVVRGPRDMLAIMGGDRTCSLSSFGITPQPTVNFATDKRINLRGSFLFECWSRVYHEWRLVNCGAHPSGTMSSDDPNHARGQRDAAVRYAVARQLNNAQGCLDTAIELAPTKGDYRKLRGIVFVLRGDWSGAEADFSRAIELNQRDFDAYSLRSGFYFEKGDVEKSIKDTDEMLRIQRSELRSTGEPDLNLRGF